MKITRMAFAAALLLGTTATAADKPARTFVMVNEDVGLPVFPYDITDRPYTVLGTIRTHVRKNFVWSDDASQKKIYKELWERADRMGSDAVINARYDDPDSGWLGSSVDASGTAIKFVAAGKGTAPGK